MCQLKIFYKLKKKIQMEYFQMHTMTIVNMEEAACLMNVYEWGKRISEGNQNVEDNECFGLPSTTLRTEEHIDIITR